MPVKRNSKQRDGLIVRIVNMYPFIYVHIYAKIQTHTLSRHLNQNKNKNNHTTKVLWKPSPSTKSFKETKRQWHPLWINNWLKDRNEAKVIGSENKRKARINFYWDASFSAYLKQPVKKRTKKSQEKSKEVKKFVGNAKLFMLIRMKASFKNCRRTLWDRMNAQKEDGNVVQCILNWITKGEKTIQESQTKWWALSWLLSTRTKTLFEQTLPEKY